MKIHAWAVCNESCMHGSEEGEERDLLPIPTTAPCQEKFLCIRCDACPMLKCNWCITLYKESNYQNGYSIKIYGL